MDQEILTTRGAVLLVQGQYAKAEDLLKQALTFRQLKLGASHPDLSMTLALLGDLYLRTGRFSQAQDSYRQALRLIEAKPLEFNTRIARLLIHAGNSSFKAHVNVGFFLGAELKDTTSLLEGSGKRMPT